MEAREDVENATGVKSAAHLQTAKKLRAPSSAHIIDLMANCRPEAQILPFQDVGSRQIRRRHEAILR